MQLVIKIRDFSPRLLRSECLNTAKINYTRCFSIEPEDFFGGREGLLPAVLSDKPWLSAQECPETICGARNRTWVGGLLGKCVNFCYFFQSSPKIYSGKQVTNFMFHAEIPNRQ